MNDNLPRWLMNLFGLLMLLSLVWECVAPSWRPSPEPSPTAINAPTPRAEREPPGAWICATLPGDCHNPGRLCCNGDLCKVEAAGKVWWCEVRDCGEEVKTARSFSCIDQGAEK